MFRLGFHDQVLREIMKVGINRSFWSVSLLLWSRSIESVARYERVSMDVSCRSSLNIELDEVRTWSFSWLGMVLVQRE